MRPLPDQSDPLCLACPPGTDADGDGFCGEAVVVEQFTTMSYLANTTDPGIAGLAWTTPGFPDGSWLGGVYGVGYDTAGDAADLIDTVVPAGSLSVYTRATFEIVNVSELKQVLVSADRDDGYVVWVNGVEAFRSPEMPPGDPTWDTPAAQHESSNGTSPNYGVPNNATLAALPALVNGTNVVAHRCLELCSPFV